MLKKTYKALREKYDADYYETFSDGCRVRFEQGSYKGQCGTLVGFRGSYLCVRNDNGEIVVDDYNKIAVLGPKGEPIKEEITDILGQSLSVGDWVVCSVRKGKTGVDTAVGKKWSISKRGNLSIIPYLIGRRKVNKKNAVV